MPLMSGIGPLELALIVLMSVAPVIVMIAAILWLVDRARGPRSSGTDAPDPRAILAERLARGEITPEDFDTAMRALGYGEPRA